MNRPTTTQSVQLESSSGKDVKSFTPRLVQNQSEMSNRTASHCLDLPKHDICQKIYHLSSYYCVALIQSMENAAFCQLHIKLIEKETNRSFCLDKILLLELIQKLNQFERVNVEYPCASGKNSCLSVKQTSIPGEYQVKFQSNKLNLDQTTVRYLIAFESVILEQIKLVENCMREGVDEVDI